MDLRSTFRAVVTISLALGVASCGWLTRSAKHEEEFDDPVESADERTSKPLRSEVLELRQEVSRLQERLALLQETSATLTAVQPPAAAQVGKPALPKILPSSAPKAGLSNEEPVQAFRDAMIRFDSGKYPEAIVAFSAFLKENPDHALAGAAQFHVAESYHRKKEPKLALAEFQRVLVTYNRSSYVPEALSRLVELQESMNLLDDAAENRQLLSSLYPMSPAARRVSVQRSIEKKASPKDLDEPPLDESEAAE